VTVAEPLQHPGTGIQMVLLVGLGDKVQSYKIALGRVNIIEASFFKGGGV